MKAPPWLHIALDDLASEVAEVRGPGNHPRISDMLARVGLAGHEDDRMAWCAASVCAWVEDAKIRSPRSPAARSFLKWGADEPEGSPRVGSVCVLWRVSPKSWQGHVGLYLGSGRNSVYLLGGNQSNSVSIAPYPASRVLGFRWPMTGGT